MQWRIDFAIAELGGEKEGTPLLKKILSALRSMWDSELYLAEVDTFIDGKKVTSYRWKVGSLKGRMEFD